VYAEQADDVAVARIGHDFHDIGFVQELPPVIRVFAFANLVHFVN
jgi:hypothetical protein